MTDGPDGPGALADLSDGGDGPDDADGPDGGKGPWTPTATGVAVVVLLVVGTAVGATLVDTGPGETLEGHTPTVAADVSYDAGTDAATVRHAGGESLDAGNTDRLRVVVENRTGATVTERSLTAFPYEAGDEFVVGLDAVPGGTVSLVWSGPVGDDAGTGSAILAAFEVPDGTGNGGT